ncbi:MAG: type II CAAX endopeptidase family protein [Bacillota bacterium]|nr:type II CAAX endopeptidase family protein [Bacillota bacterium]
MGYRQSSPNSNNLKRFMLQHPLFSFFFMAYAFSWITLIPYIFSEWGILPHKSVYKLFFVLNPFAGPTLAAYIMNRLTGGTNFRKRLKQFQVGWKWYAFILLGIPAVLLFGTIILPGAIKSFRGFTSSFFITYPLNFIIIFFLGGPLGEEIGWRGYALPRMQSRFGEWRATLLLGVLWTFWHLPHFLTSAQRGGPGTGLSIIYKNLPIFFLAVMATTIIFTWVFNHTKGSLFIVILLHTSINSYA